MKFQIIHPLCDFKTWKNDKKCENYEKNLAKNTKKSVKEIKPHSKNFVIFLIQNHFVIYSFHILANVLLRFNLIKYNNEPCMLKGLCFSLACFISLASLRQFAWIAAATPFASVSQRKTRAMSTAPTRATTPMSSWCAAQTLIWNTFLYIV